MRTTLLFASRFDFISALPYVSVVLMLPKKLSASNARCLTRPMKNLIGCQRMSRMATYISIVVNSIP
jgi:hypothetical protein